MEIIIGVIVFGVIGYFIYNSLNKEKADGSHPLDSIAKPVEEKQPAEVYEPVKTVVEPTPAPAPVKAKKAPAKKAPAKPAAKQAKKKSPAKTAGA